MDATLIISNILLWLLVIWNILLTLALVRKSKNAHVRGGLKAGQTAPEFNAQTLNGEKVSLATYSGRKVAFLFSITWCSHCRKEAPTWDALANKAAHAGVELVLVNYGSLKATRAFVQKFCPHLPALAVSRDNRSLFKDFNVNRTPAYCLIDEQGIVQAAGDQDTDEGAWEKLIESWTQLSATHPLDAKEELEHVHS